LESEAQHLEAEIAAYEELVDGKALLVESDLADLPDALIKARIANRWSQKQLADKLKVHEQQVQRYEASRYKGASFERLLEIAKVLGVRVRQTVVFTHPAFEKAMSHLKDAGFEKNFLEDRILSAANDDIESGVGLQNVLHVFGWNLDTLSAQAPLRVPAQAMGGARFKLPKGRNPLRVEAYAAYAYRLAQGAARAAEHLPRLALPTDAAELRAQLGNAPSFKTFVDWAWDRGTVVLLLSDPGAFHGAFWRINGRNVIVLKQVTTSEERLLHDAIHETFHAAQEPEKNERTVVESEDYFASDADEEKDAAEFASNVLLDGNANELAIEAAALANHDGAKLKGAVQATAKKHRVSVGALANHLAWVLSKQKKPFNRFWGAAANLQSDATDDVAYAKAKAFEMLTPSDTPSFDEQLLFRALRAEVSHGDPEHSGD
jgi:transcriptional regulator with XRE-family HTH domain